MGESTRPHVGNIPCPLSVIGGMPHTAKVRTQKGGKLYIHCGLCGIISPMGNTGQSIIRQKMKCLDPVEIKNAGDEAASIATSEAKKTAVKQKHWLRKIGDGMGLFEDE